MRAAPARAVLLGGILAATFPTTLFAHVGPASAAAPSAAARAQQAALSAARREERVRITTETREDGVSFGGVTNVGPSGGDQRFTVHKGASSGTVEVRLVGGTAYLRGDAFALETFMGFKEAASSKYAGTWVAIGRSNADYAVVASGLTFASALGEITLAHPSTLVTGRRLDGVAVEVVSGSQRNAGSSVTISLTLRAGGSRLPVRETQTSASSSVTAAFSNWGERVHEAVPSRPVPIARTGLE